jgi:thiaminase/transcriptional activator TenA
MTRLTGLVHATLTSEMALHRETCAAAGLTPAELEATRPTPTTYAYTRFLLHTAERGTLGETIAAVLPCQCGYGEIALRLVALPGAQAGPYAGWIDSYAGEEYQTLAAWLAGLADRLYAAAGPDEQARMADAYAHGLQYEYAFWQMALHGDPWPLG